MNQMIRLGLTLALLGACGADDSTSTSCDQLAATLTDCGFAPDAEFMDGCAAEPALADRLAGQTCEQLAAVDGKSDLFGSNDADRVFEKHANKRFAGTNPLRGTRCGLTTTDDGTLYYNWDRPPGADPNFEEYLNSISQGHFSKAWFRRELISSDGGPFSLDCLIRGRCEEDELAIRYDGSYNVTSMKQSFDGKVVERCVDIAPVQ